MRFNHLNSLYFSGAVFLIFLTAGFLLSQQKLLWNDELYTQQTAIDVDSYGKILGLDFPDGNKNPLFYMIQKAVCDIFSFHLPEELSNVKSRTRYIPAQIIMRIPSNVYMSLALALIFYFFIRFFSAWAGLYALCVAVVTPMFLDYWVEARPYPLWFLLTTIQLLLFSYVIIFPKVKKVKALFVTHLLLALTTPACIAQLFIVTLMLGLKRRYDLKQLILVWGLPTGIAVFYYLVHTASTIRTYMFGTNFFDVFMPERLFLYSAYALAAWVLPKEFRKLSWNAFFLPVFLLFLASAFIILYVDLFNLTSDQGFFSRYLIYVTPADILMFCFSSIDFYRWSRPNPWVCMNVVILLGGLVIMRGLITYRGILAAATYLHAPGF